MSFHRQDALDYHSRGRRGKIAVVPTKPAVAQRDLSLAYSPGVAEPCREIAENPEDVFKYTARGNLVAVVSNGTAVLGLGNIGPLAPKPVMEGKGVLFKRFADIDVFDLEVNSTDPDDVIRFCELLEPTVGGINLEDFRSPECFYIEEELQRRLDIPVFHDDQHGTAVISGAALLNALEITGKRIEEVRIVFSGAGASAISTAEHYVRLGVPRENILLSDSHGVVHAGRDDLDAYKARFAQETPHRSLAEAMRGADVFVGLSVGGVVSPAMVAAMAERPIVFALANPDPEILLWVAPAVAQAAMETGVARIEIDLERYRKELEARLGRGREVMRSIMDRARRDPRRVVYPEGEHERVIRAAARSVEEEIAHPVLLGRADRIRQQASELGISLDGIEVVDPWTDDARQERYAEQLYQRRQRKGITLTEARERVRRPVTFACMMLCEAEVDALVAGEEMYYPDTLRPALQIIGTNPDVEHVAGLYMMVLEKDLLFFADTTVNIDPDAETLAEIALLSARFVRRLGIEPRVAMLSFSNFGSVRHREAEKVRRAVELVKSRDPELIVDGEMHADTAVIPEIIARTYPFSRLQGPANVLIFPVLSAANVAYKLLSRLGGAEAIGPILMGMARPVHVLERGSDAASIVNLTALAVVDAQERDST